MTGPVDLVLQRLREAGCDPKKNGNGWKAQCPAHDDRAPSLSLATGDDGRALLCCHAGCDTGAIVTSLGITVAQLMPESDRKPAKKPERDDSFPTADAAITALCKKLGEPAARWTYVDAIGDTVGVIVRWNRADGAKEIRPVSKNDAGRWIIGAMPEPRPIYKLAELGDASRVFVVEGEKCADSLRAMEFVATTSAGGSKAPHKTDWTPLAGKDVVILPDNDDPGRKYAKAVRAKLTALTPPATVRLVALPRLGDGGDVADFIATMRQAGRDDDAIRAAIEAITESAQPAKPKAANITEDREHEGRSSKSISLKIAEDILADPNVELFHDGASEPRGYVSILRDGRRMTYPIKSSAIRLWIRERAFNLCDEHSNKPKVPSNEALQEIVGQLEAHAVFNGPVYGVALRTAWHDGEIYVDLCDDRWRAVRVTPAGWNVVESMDVPVRFTRTKGMLALPEPQSGGSFDELRELVNVPDDSQWALIVAWLVMALRPSGPYPVLCVNGEQGSAKSSLCRALRAIVDPNVAPLRQPPRDVRDLMVTAANSQVFGLDNVSFVSHEMSDALCSLATGGGFATRLLYTDCEEQLFHAARPILLNAINNPVTRGDLADRCLFVNLPTIPENRRRTEADLNRAFASARPRIVGALLTAMSTALRNFESTKLAELPRMADFAHWAVAAEPALGLESGEFMQAYVGNRGESHLEAIEHSPIGNAIVEHVRYIGHWSGTARELLAELDARFNGSSERPDGWPKSAAGTANLLKRLAPALRSVGLSVDMPKPGSRTNRGLVYGLAWLPPAPVRNTVSTVAASASSCRLTRHDEHNSARCSSAAGAGISPACRVDSLDNAMPLDVQIQFDAEREAEYQSNIDADGWDGL